MTRDWSNMVPQNHDENSIDRAPKQQSHKQNGSQNTLMLRMRKIQMKSLKI